MAKALISIMYRYTNAELNSDKFFEMTMKDEDSFSVRWGRFGSKGLQKEYPMSEWERVKDDKIQKGYTEVERKAIKTVIDDYDDPEYELDDTPLPFAKNAAAFGVTLLGP
jgi:predicted DNA-binding WGR domain protein